MKSNAWVAMLLGLGLVALALRPRSTGGGITTPMKGRMPDWVMKDLDGRMVAGTNLVGRILFINFWATYCPPCRAEVGDFVEFTRSMPTNQVMILGASTDESPGEVVPGFAKSYKINYPMLVADGRTQEQFGGIFAIPTTFIVDRRGEFQARHIGPMTRKDLERWVTALSKE